MANKTTLSSLRTPLTLAGVSTGPLPPPLC